MKKHIFLGMFLITTLFSFGQTATINGSNSSAFPLCVGSTSVLTANITGGFIAGDTLSWVQQINGGTPVVLLRTDATTATFTIPAVITGNSYLYTMVVRRGLNSYPANVTITTTTPPTVTVTPAGPLNLCFSETILLTATNIVGATYQWKSSFDGNTGTWMDIPGQITDTYTAGSLGSRWYGVEINYAGCVSRSYVP